MYLNDATSMLDENGKLLKFSLGTLKNIKY